MGYRIRGTVLPDGGVRDIYVTGDRITFEGQDDVETLVDDVVVLPGLVDAHAHLGLASPSDEPSPRARAEASARTNLDVGVLLIREPGGPDHASTGIGPNGGLPRVQTAGRFLAPPGTYFPGLAREVADEDAPEAAVEELAAGTGWVKVIGDAPFAQPRISRTYGAETLAEIVGRIHAAGGRCAIHAMESEVIQDAIEAGFDSIEHGSGFRTDQVQAAAERGIAWVPTRIISDGILEMARDVGYPRDEIDRIARYLARQPEVLGAAVDAGVTILAGTDAGMGPHGQVRREVELLVEAGLDPAMAIGAASWTARSFFGLPGIEEGAPADLVAYRDDPREDPGVLADPLLALLDGRVVLDRR
jgi:imidazolonepropionase-like amidohydrolase